MALVVDAEEAATLELEAPLETGSLDGVVDGTAGVCFFTEERVNIVFFFLSFGFFLSTHMQDIALEVSVGCCW